MGIVVAGAARARSLAIQRARPEGRAARKSIPGPATSSATSVRDKRQPIARPLARPGDRAPPRDARRRADSWAGRDHRVRTGSGLAGLGVHDRRASPGLVRAACAKAVAGGAQSVEARKRGGADRRVRRGRCSSRHLRSSVPLDDLFGFVTNDADGRHRAQQRRTRVVSPSTLKSSALFSPRNLGVIHPAHLVGLRPPIGPKALEPPEGLQVLRCVDNSVPRRCFMDRWRGRRRRTCSCL